MLRTRLLALHPYDVPEVIALDITNGHPPYLEWLCTETGA
ncbi:MAG TPA: divalent cation tolerance protein CutA [Rhodanobacter sp.]